MIAKSLRKTERVSMRPPYAGVKLLSIVAASLFLLVVAVTWNVEYMFTMSASLLVLPLVSIAICILWTRGLSCSRSSLRAMTEGEVREVSLTLSQRYFTNLALQVRDSLPQSVVSDPPMPLTVLLPGTSRTFCYSIEARKRGVYEIGPLRAGVCDPLGLINMVRRFDLPQALVVYPKPLKLQSWMMASSSGPISPPTEAAVRTMTGGGTEIYGTRKYYPGDDLRHVHWKSAARARDLIVMEFQEESQTGDVIIAIDTQSGSEAGVGEQTTLDLATRAAAYIAESTLDKGGSIKLVTGGSQVVRADSHSDFPFVLDALARAAADGDLSLAEVLSSSRGLLAPGSALALVGSKVDDELRGTARDLVAGGVSVCQVFIDPESFSEPSISHSVGLDYLLDPNIPCWRVAYGDDHE
jgi:uncharacterized protein (DUF58 family)